MAESRSEFDAIVQPLAGEGRRESARLLAARAQSLRADGEDLAAAVVDTAAGALELGLPLLDAMPCIPVAELFDPPDAAEMIELPSELILRVIVDGQVGETVLPPDGGDDFGRCTVCSAWLWVPPVGEPKDPGERYVCTGEVHNDEQLQAHGLLD